MNLKKNISLSFFVQIGSVLLSFISSILITRLLGAAGRGEYVLFNTSSLLLVQVASFGIDTSISYYAASKKISMGQLVATVCLIFVILCVLVASAVGLFPLFPKWKLVPQNRSSYYLLLFLFSIIQLANSFFAALFNGIKEFRKVMFLSLLLQILTLIACFFFLIVIPTYVNVRNFLYAIVIINFLICLIYFAQYFFYVKVEPTKLMNKAQLKVFLSYSTLSFGCSLLQFLNYKMDFWIINYYYGNANLGVYSLSATLSQLIWIVPQSIALIMFPVSAYLQKEELTNVTNKLCRVSILLSIIFLPIVAVFGLLIPKIFGKDFTGSVSIFFLFLIGVLPYVLIKIIASIFAGTGKIIYNFWATLGGFLIALVLYLVMIPVLGLPGGAIASTISYLFTCGIGITFYKVKYNVPLREVVMIKYNDVQALFSFISPKKHE